MIPLPNTPYTILGTLANNSTTLFMISEAIFGAILTINKAHKVLIGNDNKRLAKPLINVLITIRKEVLLYDNNRRNEKWLSI